jgi:transmembrane protein
MNPPSFLISMSQLPGIGTCLLALTCVSFLWTGVAKTINFSRSASDMRSVFWLPFPNTILVANIVVVFAGAILMISGYAIWLGAGALAVFTLVATCIAHSFWNKKDRERRMHLFIFLDHMCIVGALLFIAWLSASGRI